MSYYRCSTEQLHLESQRRGFAALGTRDQLGEALKCDDDARGTDATTVTTEKLGVFVPRDLNLSRTAEFGKTTPATILAGERIVYWTMNTFFPTLQLFFASGRSCTIDGGRLSDVRVGLDAQLRFRLTDCTHEEEGRMIKSMRPDKYSRTVPGILIKEAIVAQRTSMAMRTAPAEDGVHKPKFATVLLVHEVHTVVGLRLDGMKELAYVWARVRPHTDCEGQTWGDVRIGALRDDAPAPMLALPMHAIKSGGEVILVDKASQIRITTTLRDGEQLVKPII